ncbi:MAG: zinc ribbon domain-containing protein [Acetatifactor sp.]|nr:zinc ribbon domain-containing protein [Acetatifactor sp.]
MVCKNCGAEIYDADKFCTACGAPNDIPRPTEEREIPEWGLKAFAFRRKVRKVYLIMVIIIAIWAVLEKL